MMEPPPFLAMRGTAALLGRYTLLRLVLTMRKKSSEGPFTTSRSVLTSVEPKLFTRMSSRPSLAATSSTMPEKLSSREASKKTTPARPPAAISSSAICCPASRRRTPR